MKNIIILFLVFCNSCTFCDICSNEAAVQKFSEDLTEIEYSINKPGNRPIPYPAMISRLEKVTHIDSESDHGYFGALMPTLNDIVKWRSWLETHKAFLCWDKEGNQYYLSREVKNSHEMIKIDEQLQKDTTLRNLIKKDTLMRNRKLIRSKH